MEQVIGHRVCERSTKKTKEKGTIRRRREMKRNRKKWRSPERGRGKEEEMRRRRRKIALLQ